MTSTLSPEGRRILVAVVTGEAGDRIQAWREQHDPEQARRLPPHATLCYWAPAVAPETLERQVRHAFPAPFDVCLGEVRKGDNDQETFYVEVLDREPLDSALACLYDGTYVEMPKRRDDWLWHVTCVRESRGRDQDALMVAAKELCLDVPWTVDTVAYMELQGDTYAQLASWRL
jgi:hypothetical protein